MKDEFIFRQLRIEDWQDLRAIRLEGLKADPGVFLMKYEDEVQKEDAYWQRGFLGEQQQDRALFGVYKDNQIIGMGGIFPQADEARAGRLGGGYISAAYRGQGLAKQLFALRVEWAKASGFYDKLYVLHREGNKASQAIIKGAGFKYLSEDIIDWPDGSRDKEYLYHLNFK